VKFSKLPIPKEELSKISKLVKKLTKFRVVRYSLFLLLIIVVVPIIFFFLLKPKPQEDIIYGINFSNKYATQLGLNWKQSYLAILNDLGTKDIRIVAYWDDIEKTMDNYDYSDIMWQLDEAQKRDVNVILSLGRKVPRYPECFEPDWWKNIDNPKLKNLELYEYVKETVKALKTYDSIKIWQVENEPFWPFGECTEIKESVLKREVEIVRNLDNRPILTQDSGEGGFWYPTYKLGDYLGISMYRRIWYDFWGVFLGRSIYFKYPLAYWTYKIKAHIFGVPPKNIIVTELQSEPWGPDINSKLSPEEKDKTMSKRHFISTLNYAQKTGFDKFYFWGAEWWLLEKEKYNNPFYWDTAKALFR